MPRALWRGAISFGLEYVPVEVHTASGQRATLAHAGQPLGDQPATTFVFQSSGPRAPRSSPLRTLRSDSRVR